MKIQQCCWLPIIAAALSTTAISTAAEQTAHQAMVTNKNTVFHRLYIIGKEEPTIKDRWVEDLNDLKAVLETDQAQASGSTSNTLDEPSVSDLVLGIGEVVNKAKSGEEIFIYYTGHGRGGPIDGDKDKNPEQDELYDELIEADGETSFTDDDMAFQLKKVKKNVSVTLFLDTCYGGGFTGGKDDFQEGPLYKVIGTKNKCPTDKSWDWVHKTFTEALTDAVGGAGDYDGDGSLTADEAKKYLGTGWRGFYLGPPDDGEKKEEPSKKEDKSKHKKKKGKWLGPVGEKKE